MLDKDFDKLFGEKLGETQSFQTANEDWENLLPRLERDKVRIIPYKAYLVAATVAMLLLANGYTLYRLNHSEGQLQDIRASIMEQSQQIAAVQEARQQPATTSTAITTPVAYVRKNTVVSQVAAPSTSQTPRAVAVAKTVQKPKKTFTFAENSSLTFMPLWTGQKFKAPNINTAPGISNGARIQLGVANKNLFSNKKQNPSTTSTSDLNPYQKALLNQVLDYNEIQQAQKKQQFKQDKKRIDFDKPDVVDAEPAKALSKEKHLIQEKENNKQTYSPFSLVGVNVGSVVGAGLISNKFMQQDYNEVVEGAVNAGLRVEFDFAGDLRLYSDLEYMNINRWTDDFDNTAVPDIESPGPEFKLDAVVLNQTFYQYTLGMKYFFDSKAAWQPFLGTGFSSQLTSNQKYKYNYTNLITSETAETDLETKDRSFIYNTVNINAGMEYNFSRDFMLQLEGYYNTNIKKESASIPNLYGVKASILYNI